MPLHRDSPAGAKILAGGSPASPRAKCPGDRLPGFRGCAVGECSWLALCVQAFGVSLIEAGTGTAVPDAE
jgi:hypothetical protein